jgi:DNA (cytosine-5)-methyltransferase 1
MTPPLDPGQGAVAPAVRLYADEAIVDNFAGGGGASTGIEMALGRSPDVAINHNLEALAMHRANHPATKHVPDDVFRVDPVKELAGRRCGLAWFSPDCTFFSKAKGGKPFRDRAQARKVRGLIGVVLKWAANPLTRPRVIAIENVEEIEFWCPLGDDGRPDPKKRGQSFQRWVARLRNLGYVVEWRQLRACDFGAPTTRKRLFIIARCDGQPIRWPEPTHGRRHRTPLRPVAECIDFSIPVPSIFFTPDEAKEWARAHGLPTPRRPLAEATLRRVARGVKRFVIDAPEPFIVNNLTNNVPRPVSEPLATLLTGGHKLLVQPSLLPFLTEHANASSARVFGADEPLRTICATPKGGHFALVEPMAVPLLMLNSEQRGDRVYSGAEPIRTLTAANSRTYQLVTAFLAKHNGGHEATGQELRRPSDTITVRENKALTTCHLLKFHGEKSDESRGQDLREPIRTLDTANRFAAVYAFLVKFYGTAIGVPVNRPLDTVTTLPRFGLVIVMVAGEPYVIVDIGMRMLTPRELFLAQGFPASYEITTGLHPVTGERMRFTKKAQTRLVGNSVSPHVAAAIVRANYANTVAGVA